MPQDEVQPGDRLESFLPESKAKIKFFDIVVPQEYEQGTSLRVVFPKTADELTSGVTYPGGSGAGGAGDGGGDPPLQAEQPHWDVSRAYTRTHAHTTHARALVCGAHV